MSSINYLQSPNKSPILNILNSIKAIFLIFLSFAPFVIINTIQFASVVLMFVAPRMFRSINRFLANYYWGLLVFILEKVNKIDVEIFGDAIPMKESVFVDSNHQNIGDITILMVLAWKKKRLGDLKFFVKDIVKYFPGPGWGMVFLDCIFVKRNWMADKEHIDRTFRKFRENNIPIWIVSFLEGTRITPSKLARSQSFMKRRNLPHTKNVMAPRTKGFVTSVQALRKRLDAVYNITIHYPEGIPSLWQLFKGDCKHIQMHVRRTPVRDLPTVDSQLETWIIDAYVQKDDLLEKLKSSTARDPFLSQKPGRLNLIPGG